MNQKIYVITGHYGSGKSEFSVNFAKHLQSLGHKICLADLDVVNTYFRSREVREDLEKIGIQVVSDTMNSSKGLDMPYLSGAINGALILNQKEVILDCGGDDVGIRVINQFFDVIIDRPHEVYMIINVFRPETASVEQIIRMKNRLENESQLKVTSLINNSNFLRETTVDDMIYANQILQEVSIQTKCPIQYVTGLKKLIDHLPEFILGERFVMDLTLRNEWL